MAWCQSGSKPLPETASYMQALAGDELMCITSNGDKHKIFRILIITDAGAQLKTF